MNRSGQSRAGPRGILVLLVVLASLLTAGLFLLAQRAPDPAVARIAPATHRGDALPAQAEQITLERPARESDRAAQAPEPQIDVRDSSTGKSEAIVSRAPPPASGLSGRVTETGLPLAGARLRLEPAEVDPARPARLDTRTDADGRYGLTSVPPGAYRLQVRHYSRSNVFESALEMPAGGRELDLDLPLAVIQGQVLDPYGAPLAGIRVRTAGSAGAGALSQPDGRYVLRGVPSDVDLLVVASGRGFQPGASAVVRLTANEVRSGVDLALWRGADLNVLVRGAEGGRPSWRVQASYAAPPGDASSILELQTDNDGRVRFDALAPGRWLVRIADICDEVFTQEQIVEVALDVPNDVVFRVY